MNRTKVFALLAGIIIGASPLLMAPTGGGIPSKPTFQTVTVRNALASTNISIVNTGAPADAKNTLVRSFAGGFAISTATDAAPDTAVVNAYRFNRTGAAVTALELGNATNNPAFNFLGNGTAAFGGALTVGGINVCLANGTNCPAGASPGGASTNVQYRNGGVFTGSSEFLYDTANRILSVGDGSAGVGTYTAGLAATTTSTGQTVRFRGGPGGSTSGGGGSAQLIGGTPVSGAGGIAFVTGSNGQVSGAGGAVIIGSGSGAGSSAGGDVTIQTGLGAGGGSSGSMIFNIGSTLRATWAGLTGVLDFVDRPTHGGVQLALQPLSCTTACSGAGLIVGREVSAVKTATTNRASVTAVAVDPDLQVTGLPDGFYAIDAVLQVNLSAAVTPGFRFDFNSTAVTAIGNCTMSTAAAPSTTASFPVLSASTALMAASQFPFTGGHYITCRGFVQAANGTNVIGLRWAQQTSDVNNTGVAAGSFMRIRRLN